ncbi:thermonuclease family protein [Planococcus beigongshangi]|uniref:thermonuclease family protein n=1 Tax=Planococcus beigongshangi TaxID=2782536 RepID=UPI00193C58B0|nr:thermonuclease family protein [Planococcus beigongshangi]
MRMAAFILLTLLLSGCTLFETSETEGGRIPAEVLSVIDGDTIRIMYEGEETTVRYLLIDTPETNHPRFGEQPLGKEATEENRRLLEAGDVTIELDEGDHYDDYDRLLAYIYADGESIQEQLLASGLARVAYVFPPNTRYQAEFEEAEQEARDQNLGVWESENYVTDRGFDSNAFNTEEKSDTGQDSGDCNIKGNINRQGDKIYHMPGSPSYEQTNPEEWFCSEQEARDNGFRSAGQ